MEKKFWRPVDYIHLGFDRRNEHPIERKDHGYHNDYDQNDEKHFKPKRRLHFALLEFKFFAYLHNPDAEEQND